MHHHFESEQLKFINLNKSHEQLFRCIYSNPKLLSYIGKPLSKSKIVSSFKNQLKPWQKLCNRTLMFAITHKELSSEIGLCGVTTYNQKENQGEIGVILLEQYQSLGLGTEIMRALVKYCFDVINYEKLVGPPAPKNIASIKMLKKAHFNEESIIRNHLHLDGEYFDTPLYTIYKSQCPYLD